MELKVTASFDPAALMKELEKVDKKRMPKVLAKATRNTGLHVIDKVREEMPNYIDRPKKFTLDSLFVKREDSRSPEATVQWKPGAISGNSGGKYLMPLVVGGQRKGKGFEGLLRARGIIKSGEFVVPTKDAPKDQFGNVPSSYIIRIISFLRAFRDPLQNRRYGPKAKKKKVEFFAISSGTDAYLSPGIYERISLFGGAIRKVFNFTTRAQYKRQFPFYEIAEKAAKEKFPEKLRKAINEALR